MLIVLVLTCTEEEESRSSKTQIILREIMLMKWFLTLNIIIYNVVQFFS